MEGSDSKTRKVLGQVVVSKAGFEISSLIRPKVPYQRSQRLLKMSASKIAGSSDAVVDAYRPAW
jgi:hypothetical protein